MSFLMIKYISMLSYSSINYVCNSTHQYYYWYTWKHTGLLFNWQLAIYAHTDNQISIFFDDHIMLFEH